MSVTNLVTAIWAPNGKTVRKLTVSGDDSVISYGSGWRKDVVIQCFEKSVDGSLILLVIIVLENQCNSVSASIESKQQQQQPKQLGQ